MTKNNSLEEYGKIRRLRNKKLEYELSGAFMLGIYFLIIFIVSFLSGLGIFLIQLMLSGCYLSASFYGITGGIFTVFFLMILNNYYKHFKEFSEKADKIDEELKDEYD